MTLVVGVVSTALVVYSMAILARVLLSWLRLSPGTQSYKVYAILYDVTEPYLRLWRRIVPAPRVGTAALDLSPAVGLAALYIALRLLALL